jgi:hypothetical protein
VAGSSVFSAFDQHIILFNMLEQLINIHEIEKYTSEVWRIGDNLHFRGENDNAEMKRQSETITSVGVNYQATDRNHQKYQWRKRRIFDIWKLMLKFIIQIKGWPE